MSRFQELSRTTPPPTTLTVVALCTVLHLIQATTNCPLLSAVTLCPRLVLGLGDWYRIVTSAVYHGSWLHLGMNMCSMVAVGAVLEKRLGTTALAVTIVASILLTSALYIVVACVAYFVLLNNNSNIDNINNQTQQQGLMYQHCVGFSGVLFHLVVLECHYGNPSRQPRSLLGTVSVSPALYPWGLLVLMQLIMPQVSFWGHLSGILVGTLHVHGYLNAIILPAESTLHDLDALLLTLLTATTATSNYCPSFVATQTVPASSSDPSTGLEAVQMLSTLLCQFLQALWVVVFGGRGHRLHANAAWHWPSLSPSRTTNTETPEMSRLTHTERETEMV